MRRIDTLLVANRGEIACRVMRTAQRMGMRCIAVYSDADRSAAHVAMADDAVRIGPAVAADSYLDIAAVVAAAVASGADAIHPGYGFLSENPHFVEAVEAAGLVFVGPTAAAMRAMGLKDAAKRLMEQAGVPVVPGYHGTAQEQKTLLEAARDVGYPVLIKARAGGGGKGMRRVDDAQDFVAALGAARREAAAAFGDDAVLIEKYIRCPRHVEVQVFGDTQGNIVHLHERDCSLQRRHQKVLEEAPAPGLSEAVRDAMTSAAVRAARAIDYTGAGTVEFIVDGAGAPRSDGFWFMEMNTRLQVEHPVTEAITGQDLVEWQLRVAAGEPLPLAQEQIERRGHAIEVRLYAEDAASGFLPQTGTLEVFEPAGEAFAFDDAGLRVDSGVRSGDAISPFYDPMIAKLIAVAPDRPAALARMATQLRRSTVLGTVTNRALLARLVAHNDVRSARLETGLIERELDALTAQPEHAVDDAIAAWLIGSGTARGPGVTAPVLQHSLAGFRLWAVPERDVVFAEPTGSLTLSGRAQAFSIATPDGAAGPAWRMKLEVLDLQPTHCRATVRLDGRHHRIAWWRGSDRLELQRDDVNRVYALQLPGGDAARTSLADGLVAPMPGRVLSVHASAGDAIERGACVLVLEAMKMEHQLLAPRSGRIATLGVALGDQVARGDMLMTLECEID